MCDHIAFDIFGLCGEWQFILAMNTLNSIRMPFPFESVDSIENVRRDAFVSSVRACASVCASVCDMWIIGQRDTDKRVIIHRQQSNRSSTILSSVRSMSSPSRHQDCRHTCPVFAFALSHSYFLYKWPHGHMLNFASSFLFATCILRFLRDDETKSPIFFNSFAYAFLIVDNLLRCMPPNDTSVAASNRNENNKWDEFEHERASNKWSKYARSVVRDDLFFMCSHTLTHFLSW